MKKIITFCIALSLVFSSMAQTADHAAGELLISFKQRTNLDEFAKRTQNYNGFATNLRIDELISKQMNVWKITFDSNNIDDENFLYFMRQQPEIEIAQYNHLLQTRNKTPNDSLLKSQWQWINTGLNAGTVDADVDADQAWDITTGGNTASGDTIVVAVVDDGISLNHPDLKANLWRNINEIPNNGKDDDGNGYIDDYNGWNTTTNTDNVDNGSHGINVAGMIGAVGNNKTGVTGINWRVKIMMIRPIKTDEAGVIKGYSYALANRDLYEKTKGAKGAYVVVTNSSWGIDQGKPKDAPLWCNFYDTLGVHGILSCGATTNSNLDVDVVGDLPTACPSNFMLSVTATNNKDVRTFSGKGKTTVDFGAPGENIYTTAGTNGYTSTSGTSFASPLTAGVVALLYSAPCSNISGLSHSSPKDAALMIKKFIMDGVDLKANLTAECVTGGRINAFNSLNLLMNSCGPCPPPAAVTASATSISAEKITWVSTDSAKTNTLEWKTLAATTWTKVANATSPYSLTNLSSCTTYQVRIQSFCKDTTSNYSQTVNFKTDGCCEPPASLSVSKISDNSVTFAWPTVTAAKSYLIRFRKAPAGAWITYNPTTSKIDTLTKCALYEAQIQTVCDTGKTAFSPLISFKTTGCGACIEANYCKSSANDNNTLEYIKAVMLNTFTNTTLANSKGYNDFTTKAGKTTTLTQGNSYAIKLTPGFSGTNKFKEYFLAWIDWNQDGTFDKSEIVFDPGIGTDTALSGFVNVPVTAKLGATRMRVTMKFGSKALSACETINNFGYGEVEDYCVTVQTNFTPCAKTPVLNNFIINPTGFKATWGKVDSAIAYNIIYKKVGAPDSDFKIENSLDTFFNVKGLEKCTDYEFKVRSICKSDYSAFTDSKILKTDCTNASSDFSNLAAINVYPNPFNQNLSVQFFNIETQNIQFELTSSTGQVVFVTPKTAFNQGNQSYDLQIANDFPSGFYLLKIKSEKGSKFVKLVKQ